jgi:hypothetical protein
MFSFLLTGIPATAAFDIDLAAAVRAMFCNAGDNPAGADTADIAAATLCGV